MARVATQQRDALRTLHDGLPRAREAAASPIIRLHDVSKAFGPTLAIDRLRNHSELIASTAHADGCRV